MFMICFLYFLECVHRPVIIKGAVTAGIIDADEGEALSVLCNVCVCLYYMMYI